MRSVRIILVLILCSILVILAGVATTYAQRPALASIGSYTIDNKDGTDVSNGPLMAGATYTVSFDIDIGVVPANTTLTLYTPMEKAKGQDVYWHLENEYEGIDTEQWQPGKARIEFEAVQGVAELTLIGSVPPGYTSEELSNGDFLHFEESVSLVRLSLAEELLDERPVAVIDQAIVAYRQALTEKESLLQTVDADPKYEALAQSVIGLAKSLNDKGYVEDASDTLAVLPGSQSEFPTPVPESSFLPYMIVIVVLAVIMILFFFLLTRARSTTSFIRQQVDEEAGRLDVLLVRTSKVDKQLAKDIEQVKEELERISGR